MSTRSIRPSDVGEPLQREVQGEAAEPRRRYDPERFDVIGRHIATALAHDNFERARQALEAEIRTLEAEREKPEFFDVALTNIGVDLRTTNTLEEELNVITVGDFFQQRIDTLLETPQINSKTVIVLMQRVLAEAVSRM